MTNLDQLKELHTQLLALKKDISAEKPKTIAKRTLRKRAEELGTKWFSGLFDSLAADGVVDNGLLESYSSGFERLIKISAPNNLKSSYIQALLEITKDFRDDLIIPVQKRPQSKTESSLLSKMLQGLPSPDEDAYLKEAIDCAGHKLYKASVVLGWCAVIDRIHRKIEQIGFAKFNVTSVSMASQNQGRFKKFRSPQNIGSLSELREVFDTVVIWIIEGMQLIDSNQHTRLKGCFDLRCQCAHPGDAPVTEYNLLSFFSDLNEIVFRNSKFQLK